MILLSADLQPSNASPVPSSPVVAPGGVGAASVEVRAAKSTLFNHALEAAKTEESEAPPEKVSSQSTDDGQQQANEAGELSPELLAVLVGQQVSQPGAGPAQVPAKEAAGEAEQTQAPAVVVRSPPLDAQAVGLPLTALMAEAAAKISDEVSEDATPGDLMPETGEDATAATSVAASTKGELRSLADTLQSLSGALNSDGATEASIHQVTAQSQAAANSALSQVQAQTLPQTDSGVRFTPPATNAQETARTYSQSAHAVENIAALSAQITRRLGSKSTSFDMELRPADMGRVEVKLEIAHDGKLTAHLRFDSPVAESEFKGRQDDLRRQLEQAGFKMDDASLSFASGDQGRGRQHTPSESSDYGSPVSVTEVASADAHSLIDAQLLAADSTDLAFYTRLSADGYGPARTLSLSLLV